MSGLTMFKSTSQLRTVYSDAAYSVVRFARICIGISIPHIRSNLSDLSSTPNVDKK